MVFFRKAKDDYEVDELEERVRARPKTREFRDLKPENKRKRKEPKKPWGKSERLLVLFFILVTAGASAFLAFSARSWKLPGIPRIKMPSFITPPFLQEETIVIEGKKKDQEKANRVKAEFRSRVDMLSGVWGLYVVRFDDGFSYDRKVASFAYGVNESETFQAASLIKLPVMAGMFMEEEDGRLDLEDKYILKNSDKVVGSGSLYSKPAGFETTYRNLVRLMGKQSDNTAFNIARKTLGDEKIGEIITKLGMTGTDLSRNETTPKDIGGFFEDLWLGDVLNSGNKEELLEFLTDTAYESWLSAGIPDETRFAHKYGRELHVVNDAGVVFASKPFVLVILSKGVVEGEADGVFPELAKAIYDIETGD